jgi:hypothetical protein
MVTAPVILIAATGCQVDVGGQTLPSPWFMTDDVQYFPAGPEFKLSREAAALKANHMREQRRAGVPGVVGPAPAPEIPPAPIGLPGPGIAPAPEEAQAAPPNQVPAPGGVQPAPAGGAAPPPLPAEPPAEPNPFEEQP